MSGRPLPKNIRSVLATDCGSTTTKAILIEKVGDTWRQTFRGEAPTTVEAPFEDVTRGVLNAATEIQELSGRKLVENGGIKTPDVDGQGVDIYISTSSAGGGLQLVVGGVVRSMTAESATRAALGAGAIVMDTFATNDRRKAYEQIERIRQLRPDMILLAGGIDGGTRKHVVALAEMVAAARPRTRLGGGFNLPIIYAGNNAIQDDIESILNGVCDLQMVENVRPIMEEENLEPARDKIHDLFMEHVMAQAPGYNRLMEWSDVPIMPTPAAVGMIMQTIARLRKINIVGVDIGGATTDVFSVFDGAFNRTVSANLGMSYSISNVLAEAGLESILRWVPFGIDEKGLRNRIGNKMIRPTTIPQTLEELQIEQAIAREALRLAFVQHKQFAVKLRGVQQERTIADAFQQTGSGESLIQMMSLDLIVGSGGVLSHAPRRAQSMRMMMDSFLPEGITELAVDSIFMMPHLGVLSSVNEEAATEVFERDCIIYLGTCVAPAGPFNPQKPMLQVEMTLPDGGTFKKTFGVGEVVRIDAAHADSLNAKLTPLQRGLDLGAGPGKAVVRALRGGVVGVVFDTRGRPVQIAEDDNKRVEQLQRWVKAMEEYPTPEEVKTQPVVAPKEDAPDDDDEEKEEAAVFTPGLTVAEHHIVLKDRRLPLEGDVMVKVTDTVQANDIVARTSLPGKLFPVNVANQLGIDPARLKSYLTKTTGETVEEGDLIGQTPGILGFFKSESHAVVSGTIESVSPITGMVIYQARPTPVEIDSYIDGRIVEVIATEGCVVQSMATLVQGIFGLGGEVKGDLVVIATTPDQVMNPDDFNESHRGKIVLGGAYVTLDGLQRARELGIAGLVTGGFDYDDIKELLGYEIGVAITGGEELGLTLIVTEGFGHIAMAPATFELLKRKEGQRASINGATQIRAGVIRPEVVVTHALQEVPTEKYTPPEPQGISHGGRVRGIRAPFFGKIGRVKSFPVDLMVMESGTIVRVMEVTFDDGTCAMLPRANVESIEEE